MKDWCVKDLFVCLYLFTCVVRVYDCVYVCMRALCGRTQNMPHAMKSACHENRRGDHRTQARHQSQPSAISATPATQNARRCRQAPRLPRKATVAVAKCHACHAIRRGHHATQAHHQSQPSAISAMPATQSDGRCRTSMSPSAMPATQTAAASTASTGTQARHQSQPSVAECHACYPK